MDNSNGWIKLYRQIMESEFYFSEPFTKVQAWIDLLLITSFKEGSMIVNGTRVKLKRGQTCISQNTLAHRWKWSRGKVDRFLNDLESQEMIEQLKSKRTSIISITNYASYQDGDTTDNATEGTTNDATNGQPIEQPTEQPTGNILRNKEEKERKEQPHSAASEARRFIKNHFEENRELVWLSECWNEATKGLFREIAEFTDANIERWTLAKYYVDNFGREKVVEAIARLPNAKFLIGKPFVDFDWLFGRDHSKFIKLIEGGYDEIFTDTDTKNDQENDRNKSEREGRRVAKAEDFYKPVHL